MKNIRIYFSLALSSWSTIMSAQTNNFWRGNGNSLLFNDQDIPQYSIQGNSMGGGGICDNQGKLLIYGRQPSLFNGNHDQLLNSDKINIFFGSAYGVILRKTDFEYYYIFWYDSLKCSKYPALINCTVPGLYYSVIDMRLDNGLGGVDLSRNNILIKKGRPQKALLSSLGISVFGDGFRLFAMFENEISAFSINKGIFNETDALIVDWSGGIPPLLLAGNELTIAASIAAPHWGDFILVSRNLDIRKTFGVKPYQRTLTIHLSSMLDKYYFDPVSGKFNPIPVPIFQNSWNRDTSLSFSFRKEFFLSPNSISSNDSFLYGIIRTFKMFDRDIDPQQFWVGNRIDCSISQYEIYSKNPILTEKEIAKPNGTKYVNPLVKLSPYGAILVCDEVYDSNNRVKNAMLHKIANPNKVYPKCGFENSKYVFANGFQDAGTHIYDYVKAKKTINYTCEAEVNFTNRSDLSIGMDSFTWFFTNEAGGIDTIVAFEPKPVYTKNGDYPYRIYGYSHHKWGYGEWYYDTLKIRIPEKPIAAFKAIDSVICRYLPLQFKNFSFAKEINPNKKPEYLWHFGDGQTSSDFEPTHTYTTPGTYTVSLFYSNGYCDSTLVKNQNIRVVDAPKPGFRIDNNRGCTPFTVNFTDTTVLNVTKKEYYFSDVDQWQTISTPKFSHTFNQPGVFRAVQRLHGYTGCIIQTDSVFIYVTSGLTANDTVHIVNSSYLDNQQIYLEWQQLPAAVKYAVFKDGAYLTETDQTILTDKIPQPSLMVYAAKGIDSCGTSSSSGRIGKPVLLSGSVQGNNDLSVLHFTPYQQWYDTEIEYTIEDFKPTLQVPLAVVNPKDSFTDKAFLQEGKLEKCYRVAARGLQNALVSYSNILCLPYKPVIYIPNSFTPNNDGLNDVFKPQVFGIEHYEIEIYNRWGQLIFGSAANGQWDANDVGPGVYMYNIILRSSAGITFFRNGTVHLLR